MEDAFQQLSEEEATMLANELKVKISSGQIPVFSNTQIQDIVAGLADRRGLIRRTFTESLGLIGQPAVPLLCKVLLSHPNVTARRAAAKTLKLIQDPISLPKLIDALLSDNDPVVQGSSVGAIAMFGEMGVNELVKVIIDPQSTAMQCGLASWGISFIGAEAPEALKRATKSNNHKVRAAAIAALGDQIQALEDSEARKILVKGLEDPYKDVRYAATTLLGKLDEKLWAMPLLIEKLNDKDPDVRKSSALSLMKLKAIEAIEQIKKNKSKEKDESVYAIFNLAIKKLEMY